MKYKEFLDLMQDQLTDMGVLYTKVPMLFAETTRKLESFADYKHECLVEPEDILFVFLNKEFYLVKKTDTKNEVFKIKIVVKKKEFRPLSLLRIKKDK